MIDFKNVWLPQIIHYADLVSSAQLEAQWLGQIEATTSVTDPDELYEQVFDDLDAETIWAENRHSSGLSAPTVAAIDGFLAALQDIDEADARSVVTSEAWATAKRAADQVVANVR